MREGVPHSLSEKSTTSNATVRPVNDARLNQSVVMAQRIATNAWSGYSATQAIQVTVDEMDGLSLTHVSGIKLLELIHREHSPLFYYQALFYLITGSDSVTRVGMSQASRRF